MTNWQVEAKRWKDRFYWSFFWNLILGYGIVTLLVIDTWRYLSK